mmetsp:Transcript_21239/g.32069  ORF Transcript_21239/g.32069 Transcript_21239/m.32069 type:complete len:161 (-) Transcript_21239:2107-2589(-)
MKARHCKLLMSNILLLNIKHVACFHDPASNHPNLPSQYTFTQSVAIDPDERSSDAVKSESPSSIVSSSMMYYGRYLVSSEAIFISGGDVFTGVGDSTYYSSDNTDDSDDDDDDDDGHSSMLSNASLRRALVSASGGDVRQPKPRNSRRRNGITASSTTFN